MLGCFESGCTWNWHATLDEETQASIEQDPDLLTLNSMATAATMDLRDAEHAKALSPGQNLRGSIGTVDADDDLEETFDLDMSVQAVAQLLALKSVELTQLQRTHDEYVKSSCEYERELEIEVDRYEKKTQQLESAALQLERDKSDLSTSMAEVKQELQTAHRREHMLQTQFEEMKWRIQRLEQANDELETAARIAQATIEDLHHKSETMLEQNVFLQHEKEELLKQLSSIIVAEVHPASISRSTSARFSRKSSSQLSEAAPVAPVPVQEENTRKGRRRKGRRPEVLETCLHLTCRKCRANKPHAHNGGSEEKGSVSAFFERLRVFLFGPER